MDNDVQTPNSGESEDLQHNLKWERKAYYGYDADRNSEGSFKDEEVAIERGRRIVIGVPLLPQTR